MPRPLPAGPLIVGYASWGECDPKIETAVSQGVNVLIWFAINLAASTTTPSLPAIIGGPNLTCVEKTQASLAAKGLEATHLISVGGWDAPHPDTSFSAAEYWAEWKSWSRGLFDGVDWDLEGNDDIASPYNTFSVASVRLVSEFSTMAKAEGYVVSMAPPQSYLNVNTSAFSLSVANPATCWHPEFHYAGRNIYAALIALNGEQGFDFVSLQLYESWSVAGCEIEGSSMNASDYLVQLVDSMAGGWQVSFSDVPELGISDQRVAVGKDRLVIGVANGWTKPSPPTQKVIYLSPTELASAYARNPARGYMFWDIADEGASPDPSMPPLYLAAALNNFMQVRPVIENAKLVDESRVAAS